MKKFRGGLFCGVALGALLTATGSALAGDFTVGSGDVVGTQTLTGPGDTGLIEAGGTIQATGNSAAIGVNAFNTGQTVINNGLIHASASGVSSIGIYSGEADALITSSGSINASGPVYGYGISSERANAQITNSGDINASGGQYGYGIRSGGDNALITNSGDIDAWGFFVGHGIYSDGANAQITNSGYINAAGNMASVGIWSLGANATVTNSGTVIGTLTAFRFFETGATLNLLAGSAIQGSIQFAYDTSATLNIGRGLNTALTFQGLPGTINSFGAPMMVQGPLVAVVDPTGFSAQDEMLTDLTRAIANAVDGRINAARFGYVPPATPLLSYAEADGPADAATAAFGYPAGTAGAASPGHGFWAAGIGAYRNQDADGPDVGFDTGLGGLLVGLDGELANGTRVGGFLGASASRFETDANSQEIDADSYFGGVYGSYTAQTYFLDASLTGGVTSQSSDRTVANNLVIGGIEHAKADYDGVFVSPSATIGTIYAMGDGTLIPSFRARYAGLFLDGYEEHGSAADLSVDDRDVNVFDFRAQLAYALAARPLNGGVLHTAFRFGADATFADNDDVEAVLLGTGLNFSVSGDDTLRGFAGLDMSWRAAGGADFFLGAEAGYDSGDAFTLDVQGGLRIPL